MITVQVYRKSDGKPVKGAKVSVHFSGLFSGGFTKNVYTESDGQAHFDTDGGRTGTIFVDGKTAKEGNISGKEIVYV